jgi:hypothetical protein
VSVFRRRRDKSESQQPEGSVDSTDELEAVDGEELHRATSASTAGPWDAADAPEDDVARLDLGSLQVPTLPEVEVRVEADPGGEVSAVLLVHGESAVQLGAFAAPRTEGIWGEVRAEIGEGLSGEGATLTEADGEFGTELRAQVPTPEGVQPVRFVGVNGPRWFLRAVFTGAAAVDPDAGKVLVESLRHVVVVRGADPMPVRDPLPLRLPREIVEQHAEAEEPAGVQPPRRGPEITEIG